MKSGHFWRKKEAGLVELAGSKYTLSLYTRALAVTELK